MMTIRHIMTLAAILLLPHIASAQNDRQHIRTGNRLYRQQDYVRAEKQYRKAQESNSQNPQAAYNLGCALLMQQKDSAAVEQFQLAARMEKSPHRRSMIFHNIGVTLQGHKLYAQAIEAYKESLRLNPSDNETRYNLALCQRLLKKQKQNGGGGNNKNKQDDKNKKQKQQQQKNKQNDKKNADNKSDKQQQQQPKPQEKMSKENAEQLLNAAMQEEKATQQRLRKSESQPRSRQLSKPW